MKEIYMCTSNSICGGKIPFYGHDKTIESM